jgi:sec-independent protein translocase protein TatB
MRVSILAALISGEYRGRFVSRQQKSTHCDHHCQNFDISADCRISSRGSMMKRMSFSETIFLFLLALIIFGPKKLPEIARMVGKTLNEFRRASNEFKMQIEQEIAHLEVEKRELEREIERKQSILPSTSAPENTTSRGATLAAVEPSSSSALEHEPSAPPAETKSAEDEPLFATEAAAGAVNNTHASPVATEALPASDAVTSSTASSATSSASQESHA